jgi:signal transduction histidine kinase
MIAGAAVLPRLALTMAQAWRRRPPTTVRLRLTALYGGLFLVVGVILVAITYALVARQLHAGASAPPAPIAPASLPIPDGLPQPQQDLIEQLQQQTAQALAQQRADALHQLLVQSAVALGVASVIAVALGWILAGRVLRRLRDITATARRLSTSNLNQRINLHGPRDELKELADTFDAMLTRLAAAFDAQRRFVANASHELRTPLTVQAAAVDVALADPHPTIQSLRTMAERIRAATRRHEHLIASLLTLARSQRGVEHHQQVDLADAVQTALATARSDIQARRLKVSCQLRPSVVLGDPALLERLAANLVDNAVRHNLPGGWIAAQTASDGATVTLQVANSGAALPADVAAALFEPFRRHTPARVADESGHGLGLSIVAAITTAHHGSCTAHPRPDGGLEVTVTLPAYPAGN